MDAQLEAYKSSVDDVPKEASIVRQALAEFLERQGFPVNNVHPPHGGIRSKDT